MENEQNFLEAEQKQEIENTENNDLKQEAQQSEQEEQEQIVISIGDEQLVEPEEITKAPEWVKELRKANREKEKKIRELEQKLNQQTTPEKKREILGKKPTLEDHDYDAEKFEAALSDWVIQKQRVERQIEEEKKAEQDQIFAWNKRLQEYEKAKAELPVEDYDDAFNKVSQLFNQTQLGIIVQGAENPALVMYALGKKPEKAAELAKLSDPVKFAFSVARLQGEIKMGNVTRKSPPPPPETRIVSGTGRSNVDKNLEALEREADRTGDRTRVYEYKRQLRMQK
jgi:hypothetical protein